MCLFTESIFEFSWGLMDNDIKFCGYEFFVIREVEKVLKCVDQLFQDYGIFG